MTPIRHYLRPAKTIRKHENIYENTGNRSFGMTCPACPAHPDSWKLENRGTGVVAAAALRAELDQVLQEVENKEALGYSWGMLHMPHMPLGPN